MSWQPASPSHNHSLQNSLCGGAFNAALGAVVLNAGRLPRFFSLSFRLIFCIIFRLAENLAVFCWYHALLTFLMRCFFYVNSIYFVAALFYLRLLL